MADQRKRKITRKNSRRESLRRLSEVEIPADCRERLMNCLLQCGRACIEDACAENGEPASPVTDPPRGDAIGTSE